MPELASLCHAGAATPLHPKAMPELRLRRRQSSSPLYNLAAVISINKMVHKKKQKAVRVCSWIPSLHKSTNHQQGRFKIQPIRRDPSSWRLRQTQQASSQQEAQNLCSDEALLKSLQHNALTESENSQTNKDGKSLTSKTQSYFVQAEDLRNN
jgi:hypothetical protein